MAYPEPYTSKLDNLDEAIQRCFARRSTKDLLAEFGDLDSVLLMMDHCKRQLDLVKAELERRGIRKVPDSL